VLQDATRIRNSSRWKSWTESRPDWQFKIQKTQLERQRRQAKKRCDMKILEAKQQIALKNILFATDLDVSANRALPFAVALADRYGAKLYAAHVVPQQAYAFAHPESVRRILNEAQDYAAYALGQLIGPIKRRGRRCEALVGNGDVAEVLIEFVQGHSADLVVVGTSSRAGLGKVLLGSVAEQVIRRAPCPVLTVGPRVMTEAYAGIQSIVSATDFSPGSMRAVEFAVSLAHKYESHLTLVHVVEGVLRESPHLAIRLTEKHLREMVSSEAELKYQPEVVVELGPVADRILRVSNELLADIIVMGVRGAGAFAQMASHFGSIAHRVVSLANCPVLTVGNGQQDENG
jgi:nucleotide-binding universal stress UspA family protein